MREGLQKLITCRLGDGEIIPFCSSRWIGNTKELFSFIFVASDKKLGAVRNIRVWEGDDWY